MSKGQDSYSRTCFICNAQNASITREHYVPKWLIKIIEDASIEATDGRLGNRQINYHKYYVPCCASCNGTLAKELESPIAEEWHSKRCLSDVSDRILARWLLKMHWATQCRDHSPGISGRSKAKDPHEWARISKYVPSNRATISKRILGNDYEWENGVLVWRVTGLSTGKNYLFMPHHDACLLLFPGHLILVGFTPNAALRYLVPSDHPSYELFFAGFLMLKALGKNEDELCPACAFETYGPDIESDLRDSLPEKIGLDEVVDRALTMEEICVLPSSACQACDGRPNAVYQGKRVHLDLDETIISKTGGVTNPDPWAAV